MTMRSCRLVLCVLLGFTLAPSTEAVAQEVTVSGVAADESKGVLPGVTVMATSVATGRQFVAVTNERGEYRLVGLSAGQYNLQADLSGFAPVLVSGVEFLVGQNVRIPFTMRLESVTQEIIVTGEAPLVDISQARVAGNVDRRQMEELPIAGRNWQQLASMVKGITANSITTRPGVTRDAAFALNLDGQDITQNASTSGFGQPGISRDAIAEFQVITSMFDVTMGRSTGIQVQAISRAGANTFGGSVYGYFRDDRFNDKDAFANRVLPYSNRQVGGTLGGPIVRDTLHFFASYEDESEPNTNITTNVDPLGLGANRIRRDLSIIPRSTFKGDTYHTLDLRVSKDVALVGSVKLTGIAELFNVYNHAMFAYNTLETSSSFGGPSSSAGPPRTGQLAFRLSF